MGDKVTEESTYHITIGEVTYGVPVGVIAKNRASYYAEREFDGNMELAMEDTMNDFQDVDEIHDWASNNMNWSEVVDHARVLFSESPEPDYEDGWVNGEWDLER